jgi:peptidyl-tRNA hydrolase, PTH1 family
VRIGVGHPGDKDRVHGHVLSDFAKADREWLEKILDAIAQAAPALASRNDADFATKLGLILKPPKPKQDVAKEKKPVEKDES